jgi:enoyl-CoA hydratase
LVLVAELEFEEGSVLYQKDAEARTATITLNRPKRLNALTHAIERVIINMVKEAEQDDDVKVLIFRGAGSAFTSGQDVEEAYDFYFRPGEDTHKRPSMRRRLMVVDENLWGKRGLAQTIFYCLKPTISVIRRRCFGAGLDLLMASDMAICSDDTLFGHPGFTYHGFGGDLASYIFHMGLKRARKFTLTARDFGAAEAVEWGLVNYSVPPDELESAAAALIADVTKMPLDALVMQKQHYRVVLDGLGFATNFSAAMTAIGFASNIKYEPGDNVMVKDREKNGVSGAIRARKQYYGHL